MKLKRIFVSIMAALASVAILTGCAPASKMIYLDDNKAKSDVTDITFYGYKADDLDFISMENILHGFMDENENLQVSYEGVKGQPYWDALELRGKNDCLDDIIMMDQEHVLSLWDTLADVKDVINLDLFNDLVKDQIKKPDGSIRFVPMTLASYCMYINYDLLAEHGFSIPKNYADFAAICEYFKEELKDEGLAPVICNQRRSLCSLVQGKSLFDVYRLDKPREDKKTSAEIVAEYNADPALLGEKLGEGLEFIEDMFNKGWLDPAATHATLQTSTDKSKNGDLYLFSKGKQPFLVSGGWAPQRLDKLLSDDGIKLDYGVHPYPIMDDGCVLVMDVNNCVSINSKGKHVDDVKAFMSYLTKPDSIWEYCDGQSCFSPLKNETRKPKEKTVAPTAEYYSNGRAVIGTNYQLDMPLDKYLMSVTDDMCTGKLKTAAEAKERLKKLLTGEEALG